MSSDGDYAVSCTSSEASLFAGASSAVDTGVVGTSAGFSSRETPPSRLTLGDAASCSDLIVGKGGRAARLFERPDSGLYVLYPLLCNVSEVQDKEA